MTDLAKDLELVEAQERVLLAALIEHKAELGPVANWPDAQIAEQMPFLLNTLNDMLNGYYLAVQIGGPVGAAAAQHLKQLAWLIDPLYAISHGKLKAPLN